MNWLSRRTPLSGTVAGVLAVVLVMVGLVATSSPAFADISPSPVAPQPRSEGYVSADVLPTVQIDSGVVWNQAVVGTTVFAGGRFSQTRPAGAKAGQQLTPRSNLLSYDLTTGNLLPFNPEINGEVKTVQASPDGKRLYIGGSFTQVNGKPRWKVAAFDTATGELLESFSPAVGGSFVNAIVVSPTTVYVGGRFTQGNGIRRTNLAAFDLDGNLTGWAPTANNQVDAMVMAPDGSRVIVGGRFAAVNGAFASASAALDSTTGASRPWKLNTIINGGGTSGGVMGLSTDGTNIYGAGWLQGNRYFEGIWAAAPNTGDLIWAADGQGDQYDVFAGKSGIYSVGHNHVAAPFGGWSDGGSPSGYYQYSMAMTTRPLGTLTSGGRKGLVGSPAPGLVQWYPKWITGKATGMGQAGWTIEGNDDYVAVGGEFLGVNGTLQQGLARFARSAISPSRQGPRLSGTPNNAADVWETPTFAPKTGGGDVTIRPNFDRDDRLLRYELYRSGTPTAVATTTLESDSWQRSSQKLTLSDTSAQPNTSYTYSVRAIDPEGNTADSKAITGRTPNFTIPVRAVATAQMSGLLGQFDASSSTVPSGAQLTKTTWDFGDGTTATGSRVEHSYPAFATYPVKLTVTDNLGRSATTTIDVTTDSTFAVDTFEQTRTAWGNAMVGGTWTSDNGTVVNSTPGQMTTTPGQTVNAWLTGARAQNVEITSGFALDKASAGGGTFLSYAARRTTAGEYRTKLVANADGTLAVYLTKIVNGKETILKQAIVPNVTVSARLDFLIEFHAITNADGATDLRVRVWPAQIGWSDWLLHATDTEPALQGVGHVGISSYLSTASTIAPQTVSVDHFLATTRP